LAWPIPAIAEDASLQAKQFLGQLDVPAPSRPKRGSNPVRVRTSMECFWLRSVGKVAVRVVPQHPGNAATSGSTCLSTQGHCGPPLVHSLCDGHARTRTPRQPNL